MTSSIQLAQIQLVTLFYLHVSTYHWTSSSSITTLDLTFKSLILTVQTIDPPIMMTLKIQRSGSTQSHHPLYSLLTPLPIQPVVLAHDIIIVHVPFTWRRWGLKYILKKKKKEKSRRVSHYSRFFLTNPKVHSFLALALAPPLEALRSNPGYVVLLLIRLSFDLCMFSRNSSMCVWISWLWIGFMWYCSI